MHKFPKFYGVVKVGARGQVVIPSDARKSLDIKSGDKLIVTSDQFGKKMIKLAPADEFGQLLSDFERHISKMKARLPKNG